MSTETNKAIARQIFEEVFNAGNLALVDELATPGIVIHYGGGETARGLDSLKRGFSASLQAFPDMHFAIDAMIAEGEQVVTRWTMRGSHRGEYLGIALHHRRPMNQGCDGSA
jgi:predicted ester cyclase